MIAKTKILDYVEEMAQSRGIISSLGIRTISRGRLAHLTPPEGGITNWLPVLMLNIPRITYGVHISEDTSAFWNPIYELNILVIREMQVGEQVDTEDTRIINELHKLVQDDIWDRRMESDRLLGKGYVRVVQLVQDDFQPEEAGELPEALYDHVRVVAMRATINIAIKH